MKRLRDILFFPEGAGENCRRAHHIWLALGITALGCGVGILTLALAACACQRLDGMAIFQSYFSSGPLLALNLLPPVLLIWLFYLVFGRVWAGYLAGGLPCLILALVNYYKIRLRGDPLLGADLGLVTEAGGIMGRYTLDLTKIVCTAAACFLLGLLAAVFLMPRGVKSPRVRAVGSLVCAGLAAVSFTTIYCSPAVYEKADNSQLINPWSDVEVFVSKGFLYPFLYSVQDMFPHAPEGYDKAQAEEICARYEDQDIPAQQKVDVVGIMLEAFCDLTDFPMLAERAEVQEVYRPWHQLEEQSVSGNLLTNIFAGGTVDSEWSFLTGYSQYDEFRSPTDSYVWFFLDQGYHTSFHHPGYQWFYNRQNVNEYLGFEESSFNENRFGQLVDPTYAVYRSDSVLVDYLLEELEEHSGAPQFSFSVSYQNHGPYDSEVCNTSYLTPAQTGWSAESCTILNNYLDGVSDTIENMVRLVQALEQREQPTVLVLFGDHKPWLGNGDSVYTELGVDFYFDTYTGFQNYYGTPYLIWANSAARQVLGNSFTGGGGDFSPCFLMAELFDQCGWEGPGFMQLSRQMRQATPLVHSLGLFLEDGQLTDQLSQEKQQLYQEYLWAQYYRETQVKPQK